MKPVSLSDLTFANFAELLNEPFRVLANPSSVVTLKLIAATAKRSADSAENASPESFSIVFNGPLDRFLPQRMYAFEQDRLGRFDLFIVPIGRDAEGFHYEAIFNRESTQTRPPA